MFPVAPNGIIGGKEQEQQFKHKAELNTKSPGKVSEKKRQAPINCTHEPIVQERMIKTNPQLELYVSDQFFVESTEDIQDNPRYVLKGCSSKSYLPTYVGGISSHCSFHCYNCH